jgi:hypothetical protein
MHHSSPREGLLVEEHFDFRQGISTFERFTPAGIECHRNQILNHHYNMNYSYYHRDLPIDCHKEPTRRGFEETLIIQYELSHR